MSETRERVHIEDGPKRVRTYLGGELIADTKRLKLVWEVPYYPAYYFPREDVRMELLTPNGHNQHSPSRGNAHKFTIKGGGREVEDAAWHYPESPVEELRDLIRFDWDAMDGWFEEDEEVYVHPHNPYTRIDILHSSRHVEVEVNGVKIADTHRPTLLFETSLPTRYYIPKLDVRMDLLAPTDTVTGCAYKGFAQYWSVDASERRSRTWPGPTRRRSLSTRRCRADRVLQRAGRPHPGRRTPGATKDQVLVKQL
jgi:uncharacterized protein (DUF427 family)